SRYIDVSLSGTIHLSPILRSPYFQKPFPYWFHLWAAYPDTLSNKTRKQSNRLLIVIIYLKSSLSLILKSNIQSERNRSIRYKLVSAQSSKALLRAIPF